MKSAIVTGAAGGIGFATVKKLSAEGFAVLGLDILDGEKVDYSGIENAHYFKCDIADSNCRAAALEKAKELFGTVDVLVNVAGVAPRVRADLLEMTEESYDRVMGINTKATMFLTQLFARYMVENKIKGYIVNISSMSAYTSSVSRGEYCISKAGVSMITTLFADRLAEYGITVNEIRPGIIHTGMTDTVKQKYDALIADGLLPIARWGQPEDIANAVYVLCSGQLGYTTGQSIDVDGGFHIRRL